MSHTDQSSAIFAGRSHPFWERLIAGWASRMRLGRLTLVFPNGREHHTHGTEPGPAATLKLHNARPVWRLLGNGSLGFAEAHMAGDWDSPDLATLLELAVLNEENLSDVASPSTLLGWLARGRHLLKRNTRAGSRRNIAFHYDLGNAFYRLWLDETMTYSSALYEQGTETLAEAQEAKYDRIIRELDIGPNDHVLEIGCGWGGFAERAVEKTGCRVTGLTLSKEQAEFARNRLAKAGMNDRAEIRIEDYRDVTGHFTKIVSIEMFEAVGEENWQTYFSRVRELLSEGGKAVVQVITIDERRFETYRRGADFIQTYIFPGGMLPSVTAFEAAARRTGLAVTDCFRFGRDYERTLLAWDRAFTAHWPRIAAMGFDERFFRMWRYYLHYCAAGFRTGRLDVVQFTMAR